MINLAEITDQFFKSAQSIAGKAKPEELSDYFISENEIRNILSKIDNNCQYSVFINFVTEKNHILEPISNGFLFKKMFMKGWKVKQSL